VHVYQSELHSGLRIINAVGLQLDHLREPPPSAGARICFERPEFVIRYFHAVGHAALKQKKAKTTMLIIFCHNCSWWVQLW
jgi:hypothetical protein